MDGKHASEFGDGHSLDAAGGNPTYVVYVNNSGNVGIGTTDPQQKMHISGEIRLEPQSFPPPGGLGDLYVGTDGKLYFHNGT